MAEDLPVRCGQVTVLDV